jgi:outer membrane protein TolC
MLRTLTTLICCGAIVSPLAAQDAPPPLPDRLTLDQALSRATAASHRLGELRAREGAARAAASGRGAARLPTLAAQVGYTRTNHVDEFGVLTPDGHLTVIYPDVPDNYRSRLELQWPIYTGGRLEALERAAAAEATASGSELAAARADLKLEVTRAYWALVTAREAARVLAEAVARVDAQLSDVRSRFDAGFVPPNDVLTVEAQRAREEVQRLEAENLAASAEADLGRLVDAPLGSRIELDASLTPAAAAPADVTAALLEDARQHRPERAALDARVEAADNRARAAHAGVLPTVSFVSGVDYAQPNPRIFPRQDAWKTSWDVGVSVGWSLWDGGRTRAEVAEASNQATAARERLADFDANLAADVRQRLLDLDTARAQIGAAEQGVKSATEARRVVQERFAAGVATTTDLLDAQVALLQAELDRTRAIAGTRLASARLDRALGR